MRLGIDFGTTRTVVAAADRGNYPILGFQTGMGDMQLWFPSLVAARGNELVCGFEALGKQSEPGWFSLRSFKRLLSEAGPQTQISLGMKSMPVLELFTSYLAALRNAISESSLLEIAPDEPLEALIAVPANANSNQRFLTLEAFRCAGFHVLGLINEPSAAGIEYAHRYCAKAGPARKEHLIVYDLGGGTFDTSIVRMQKRWHEVLTSEGIAKLGGDDFDQLLLDLALERAGISSISPEEQRILLEECRERKEGLYPSTRKIAVDLGSAIEGEGEIIVTTSEFYERCQPLVEKTMEAIECAIARVAGTNEAIWNDVSAVYLVGGSSDLLAVSRTLRQQYGKRVRRSPYPFAATAMGLAIAADAEAGYELRERFTRHFGVWREAEGGRCITFDPLFFKDTPLPKSGDPPLIISRTYRPAHNIGHFRYFECSGLSSEGHPCGDITPWHEVRFPFDPALDQKTDLESITVQRINGVEYGPVDEIYACDASGIIEVLIRNHATGDQRRFHLRS